jgi:DNA mismatch endonuclease, patch repair protein
VAAKVKPSRIRTLRGRTEKGEQGYPYPSTPHATKIMKANPSRDTGPEVRLRSCLHECGLRYRVNYGVRVDNGRPILVDVAFTRLKLAVFVDGCFWHSCPEHGSTPKANAFYWLPKLAKTVERDAATNVRLHRAGWETLRIWEHECVKDACDIVTRTVSDLRHALETKAIETREI